MNREETVNLSPESITKESAAEKQERVDVCGLFSETPAAAPPPRADQKDHTLKEGAEQLPNPSGFILPCEAELGLQQSEEMLRWKVRGRKTGRKYEIRLRSQQGVKKNS